MAQTIYRFEEFELNTSMHALLKQGRRLGLQEQPYQVLLALLERPGQVVTRETLRLRLWGNNTFVDFDQSLNSAVRRLRVALGDNSRQPVYVETIPRIGFRLLQPVLREGAAPAERGMHTAEATTFAMTAAPGRSALPGAGLSRMRSAVL